MLSNFLDCHMLLALMPHCLTSYHLTLSRCALFLSVLYIFLLVFSIAENYMVYAHTFTHPPSVPLLFFHLSSSSCMHCSSPVSIATPVFLSDTHGCPVDFDPQISVSRDHSLARLGEVTEMSVFSHRREKGGRKSARCNKLRVRDDGACDPIFSPLRF